MAVWKFGKHLMKRDYRLGLLPVDAEGIALYSDSSDDSYTGYVKWLANYLYTTELPHDVADRPDLKKFCTTDVFIAAYSLGSKAAWRENDELQAWVEQQVLDGEREADDESAERLSGKERAELLGEAEEAARLFGDYRECYADLGWRIPLAVVLRRVDTEPERIEVL